MRLLASSVLLALCAACASNPDARSVDVDAQLATLREALVHVERPDPDSPLLLADASAVASAIDDAQAQRLFAPLASRWRDLSLARTRIGAGSLAWLERCEGLERLDLRGCVGVDDAFVARVARLPRLSELVLAGTRAGDGCIDDLLAAPALRRVWLWRSGATPAGLARLATRPGLCADGGAKPDSIAAEVEPKPEFVNLLPPPGEAPLPATQVPINVNCPVSGAPVDARRTRLHAGRLVGFCCENCPKDFDADPKKYEGALPKP
ncbi:MAG: hypothetical protein RL112_2959 [Planctomycetota bacterium]